MHRRQDGVEDSVHVDAEEVAHLVCRFARVAGAGGDAGVGDHQIQGAGVVAVRHPALHGVPVGHVHCLRDAAGAGAATVVRDRFQARFIAPAEKQRGVRGGIDPGKCGSNAA